MKRFPIRRLPDGRAMLNLGSSARVAPGWNNVDSSWILRLARFPMAGRALHAAGILSPDRYSRLRKLDEGSICWNLAEGVPFPDAAFDVVYHSHLLEHIDRESAPGFLAECFRVLKPGGVIRVVVPDLERVTRRYLDWVDRGGSSPDEHRTMVEPIFDQMIPREPRERAAQPAHVRFLERVFVGDTARSGTLHRWMYDRIELGHLLRGAGFADIRRETPETSRIEGWNGFGLDLEPDGSPYKLDSLYMEAVRPSEQAG